MIGKRVRERRVMKEGREKMVIKKETLLKVCLNFSQTSLKV